MFFDDNAEEKEILAPFPSADFRDDVAGRVGAVDPVLALERDDDFVSIVQSKGYFGVNTNDVFLSVPVPSIFDLLMELHLPFGQQIDYIYKHTEHFY